MDKKRLFTTAFMAVLLIGCFAFSAVAQTTVGKIDGYVRDSNTNKPLLNVNVIIEGTEPLIGAATNEEGYYFILNVPPGSHTVSSAIVGYRRQRQEGIEVKADMTSTVNFLLTAPGDYVLTEARVYRTTPPAPVQRISEDLLKNFTYRGIGPTRQSGRFSDFAVVESNPKVFYAATGSGGLWKTENHGQTFTPIFDYENVVSIGDIDVSQSNPNIVWVGTGESNTSRSTYWGDGMYKSTDAGETWTHMGLPESHHIGRVVIHPTDPDIVYVAALGHLYSENPERGLYKTTNGGRTWDKILEVIDHGKYIGCVDVVMDPTNSNVLYATTYDKVRKPWTFNAGGPGTGIYKTTNAGRDWQKLSGGLPTGMLGRIELAIYPKDTRIIYANIEVNNVEGVSDEERYKQLLEGIPPEGRERGSVVYRTNDAGETWFQTHPDVDEAAGQRAAAAGGRQTSRLITVGGGPGYYYNSIRVDPNNSERVYVLATGMHFSEDGGKTWRTPPLRGGDNHAMWIDPNDSDHILLGYDHGMVITWDGGRTSYHTDQLPLAQFYAIGVDMDYPYNVYGGTQDNGSHKGPSTKRDGSAIRLEDWIGVGGGDGMYNQVDPTDSRWLYNESQNGSISRTDQITGERTSIRAQIPETDPVTGEPVVDPQTGRPQMKRLRFPWDAPIHISPHNPKTIYHGAQVLLRSTNRGDTWEAISPDLTTNDPVKIRGTGNITYCTITSISESPVTAGVIWVGTDDGNIQLTRDNGATWTKLNDRIPNNPEYWVSRVTASNHFAGTAYISYWGYKYDDFTPYVYKTTDFGETWTSIAGNLPKETVNVIKEDHKNPNLLFVGTSKAVHVTIDGGRNWTKMQNNMPTQPVHDLVIHPREDDLVVGTHGRGFFITDISPLQELNSEVLAKDAHLFEVEPKVQWVAGLRNASSSSNFSGPSEPAGVMVNYFLASEVSEVKVTVYKGARIINEMTGTNTAGINQAVWNMTILTPEQIEQMRQPRQEQVQPQQQMRGARAGGRAGGARGTTALPGEYTVTLTVAGQEIGKKKAVILEDVWYKK